jgi:hypothetical protein
MCSGRRGCEEEPAWLSLLANYTPGEHGTWIIVLGENKSAAEMVSATGRDSVVVFGSLLSACSIVLNLLLVFILSRRRPRAMPSAVAFPARPLLVNSSLTQLAMGAFVIPLHVLTESVGRWSLGPIMCRCWLSA